MISQTFTGLNHAILILEIASFLKSEGYHVCHESEMPPRLTCKEVGQRYGIKSAALTKRLKRFPDSFPNERGKSGRILWLCITPKLNEHLRK
jgi:hypothetical protein